MNYENQQLSPNPEGETRESLGQRFNNNKVKRVASRAYKRESDPGLFNVVAGSAHSRAMVDNTSTRFLNNQLAVFDEELRNNPSRINPNRVKLRELGGGPD